jgi:hypothetical protein
MNSHLLTSASDNTFLFEDKTNQNVNRRNSVDSINRNIIPRRLKRTFLCVLSLLLSGLILLGAGIEECIRKETLTGGIAFFVLSLIVTTPGLYYSIQFCKAKREVDIDKRMEILDEIPEM